MALEVSEPLRCQRHRSDKRSRMEDLLQIIPRWCEKYADESNIVGSSGIRWVLMRE